MLTLVDRTIPGLIKRLRENGELDNTVIAFTSDNGYHMGQHRLEPGKNLPYEEDMKVPLVVRGPGITENVEKDELVLNNDLAPTFADLAGAQVPDFVDGRSFGALMQGNVTWRSQFLFEGRAKEVDYGDGLPPHTAIRTHRYKLIEYETGERELYDLEADPYELENIAEQKPELEAELHTKLEALKVCSAEECRTAENASP
jgi:arylsulfatase A-like enzyme